MRKQTKMKNNDLFKIAKELNLSIKQVYEIQEAVHQFFRDMSLCYGCGDHKCYDQICEKCGFDNKKENDTTTSEFLEILNYITGLPEEQCRILMVIAIDSVKNGNLKK
ncbi:MAG: hypothetical protein V3V33_11625 [Candidatus Lokiarchaeia archaeon]